MSKRSKPSAVDEDERTLAELRDGLAGWASAIEAHRMAPPDDGFAARLTGLAAAAGEQARVYRAAATDYEWVPYSAGQPPYELLPDTGRRGPQNLWRRFDAAVAQLGAATEGEDMPKVAGAYADLAAAATDLAQAIEREDRASSPRPRARARRAA
jgi:hypothetical protein